MNERTNLCREARKMYCDMIKNVMKFTKIAGIIIFISAYSAEIHATNEVFNSDFDADVNGWAITTSGSGSAFTFWDNTLGSPDFGSLALGAINGGDIAHAEQCIAHSPSQPVDFIVRWDLNPIVDGTGKVEAAFTTFSNVDCTGNNLGTFVPDTSVKVDGYSIDGFGKKWTEWSLIGQVLPGATKSVRIKLDATAGSAGISDIVFDHIRFGLTGTTEDNIFADDFE